MNRTLVAVCTAVVMSAAMLGAQSTSSHTGSKAPDEGKSGPASSSTVTFTGCLSPRSTSDSFYLTSAKQKGVKAPATTVKLVPASKKVDLDAFATQQVEVSGTLDRAGTTTAASGGSNAVPTLTVTKVKSRDDAC